MQTTMDALRRLTPDTGARVDSLVDEFRTDFQSEPTLVVSAPGRTELIGNHTDHNAGTVVAAAVDRDTLGAVPMG